MKITEAFKKLGVFLTVAVWAASLIAAFFLGMGIEWLSVTDIKTTKDYSQIVIDENDVADHKVFTEVPEKYDALNQIDEKTRKTISLYMQANGLKLAEGVQKFSRNNGSLDEYINKEFRFVPIE